MKRLSSGSKEAELDEEVNIFEAFSLLTPMERMEVLKQVRDEAKKTAEEWLETEKGQETLSNRAMEIDDQFYSEMGERMEVSEAFALARRNFIVDHMEETVAEFVRYSGGSTSIEPT